MKSKNILKWVSLSVIVFILVISAAPDMLAQCPMCKMAAESNMKGGGTAGRGLNFGILYMLSLPYLLVGTLGYIWKRNSKNIDKSL